MIGVVDMSRVLALDENLLFMIASCTLIAACGALAEMILGDRTRALQDALFGGIVLGGFLLAWLMYVMGNYGLFGGKDRSAMGEYSSAKEHHHARRHETFTAQVLVISRPRKPVLPECAAYSTLSLESLAQVIDAGNYRLELVAPCSPHDRPMLIVHEEVEG
jgi:hypothetical protein